MNQVNIEHVAIHEAGHAVAQVRLEILQGRATIKPTTDLLGSVVAEGENHVYSKNDAISQVLALYAGYAALVANGHNEDAARDGAGDDFDKANHLIESWELGNRDDWLLKAINMMKEPKNIKAVKRIANELLDQETVDGDTLDILVDVADGGITEEEYERIKWWRVKSS